MSILCGKLSICSHLCFHIFIKQQYKNSAGQPFSAAEAALSITSQVYYGLRLKLMQRPRPTAETLFHQYVYFGLDSTPPASPTLFFPSSYSRTVFCFFSPRAPPEASFCWGTESLHSVFKWSGKICILYFPESPLFPPCPAACTPALCSSPPFCTAPFVHLSLPASSLFPLPLVSSHPALVSAIYIQQAGSISSNSSSFHLPWLSAFIASFIFSHKNTFFSHWATESGHQDVLWNLYSSLMPQGVMGGG